MKKSIMSCEYRISPLRSIDDFFLSSARFEKPRFGSRIVSNLHYYQTNYFLVILVVFIIFGIISPQKMLLSLAVIAMSVLAMVYASGCMSERPRIPPNTYQTYLYFAVIITSSYLVLHNFASISILLTSLLISISLILIHASMRLRNIKNKISDKMGTKNTPMGLILNAINIQNED
ncbi:unnamed protein product [Medioppia subpectinata]|uniref:PRA1 family protein n=1 Tax=Medioppia subpectinata TaxID=1979941 RepID=A0A7R9L9L4_9ACAR|nr:unnamed protein product [Medioppia subpectinata]CAG2116631.1 unnamed protein product [Medioppia subpectinata]